MESEDYNSFWAQIIPAGKKVQFVAPLQTTVFITNAVIPDVTNETPKKVIRLFAEVQTFVPDDDEEIEKEAGSEEEEQEDGAVKTNRQLIASLIPFESENQKMNVVLSPLNIVEFENTGPIDIHLTGYLQPLLAEEEEDEEEEIAEYINKNGEKPAINKNEKAEYVPLPEPDRSKFIEAELKPGDLLSPDVIQNRIAKLCSEMGPRQRLQKKKRNRGKKRGGDIEGAEPNNIEESHSHEND